MSDGHPDTSRVAEAFHCAFVAKYATLSRQKYPRLAGRLPYHGQDVHVIYGGNRWWQILCISGPRYGDMRFGPAGRFTMQGVDPETYPDLADLPDQASSRKEEFRLAMGADMVIYHEVLPPPWPAPESEPDMVVTATKLAERLVDEHASPLLEFEAMKNKLASMRNGHQLETDINEAMACYVSEHYRAAVVTLCAAAESALVGRLEEMGHPIRQEERSRILGHEHHSFSTMVVEAYRGGAIGVKTRDGLEMLTGLRRGTDHCRPDATTKDDAEFAWSTLQLLLRDLTK